MIVDHWINTSNSLKASLRCSPSLIFSSSKSWEPWLSSLLTLILSFSRSLNLWKAGWKVLTKELRKLLSSGSRRACSTSLKKEMKISWRMVFLFLEPRSRTLSPLGLEKLFKILSKVVKESWTSPKLESWPELSTLTQFLSSTVIKSIRLVEESRSIGWMMTDHLSKLLGEPLTTTGDLTLTHGAFWLDGIKIPQRINRSLTNKLSQWVKRREKSSTLTSGWIAEELGGAGRALILLTLSELLSKMGNF